MRERGYVEGHDYRFEIRYANGDVNRIPPLMEELVRLKPDIIVSGTMAGVPIVSETPARRQCNWRVGDCGRLANQTVGAGC